MNAHLPPSRILAARVFLAALAAALLAAPFTAHSQNYTASSNNSTAAITISSGNHTISVGSSGSLTRSNAITLSGGTLQGGIMDNVATVSDLITFLSSRDEGVAAALAERRTLRAAVDQNHVALDAPVAGAREVAFFPPVTGG